MAITNRRVVTGLDAQGRSKVLFDGPINGGSQVAGSIAMAWRTDKVPASNEGDADGAKVEFGLDRLNDGGTNFMVVEVAPGTEPMMHATNSIDYLVVTKGRVLLKLETEEVILNPGDLIVDRGVLHGWSALGSEAAQFVAITIPADPLGEGARVHD